MLFNPKSLASALFLSTVVLGVTVEPSGHFEIEAQPKGIDVSSHQGNVNWNAVVSNGVSFAYIKATEGTSKAYGMLAAGSTNILFQTTRTLTFPPNTLVPPKLVSSAVATTLHFPTGPQVLLRPLGSLPMVEAGLATASPFRVP